MGWQRVGHAKRVTLSFQLMKVPDIYSFSTFQLQIGLSFFSRKREYTSHTLMVLHVSTINLDTFSTVKLYHYLASHS